MASRRGSGSASGANRCARAASAARRLGDSTPSDDAGSDSTRRRSCCRSALPTATRGAGFASARSIRRCSNAPAQSLTIPDRHGEVLYESLAQSERAPSG